MEFSFTNDLEKNLMRATIRIKKRQTYGQERVFLGWHDVKKIVDENYVCPPTHKLGQCLINSKGLDSNVEALCEQVYEFRLEPLEIPKPKKTVAKKQVTKKTTTTKNKKS